MNDDLDKAMASLQQQDINRPSYDKVNQDDRLSSNKYFEKDRRSATRNAALFSFDPNSLSADGWKKLGIPDKTIATIQNYISKGGRFRKAEDIKKIWGLHADQVARLLPFVEIKEQDNKDLIKQSGSRPPQAERKIPVQIIDINTADTTALIALPGIGAKLANRIINFRERLGGFYRVEQVAETFGLPDSVYQKIKPKLADSDKNIRQLNINTATLEELKQHPYIRYSLANLVVQYRNQHGDFKSVAELKKIMPVTNELYDKLAPYITIE